MSWTLWTRETRLTHEAQKKHIAATNLWQQFLASEFDQRDDRALAVRRNELACIQLKEKLCPLFLRLVIGNSTSSSTVNWRP